MPAGAIIEQGQETRDDWSIWLYQTTTWALDWGLWATSMKSSALCLVKWYSATRIKMPMHANCRGKIATTPVKFGSLRSVLFRWRDNYCRDNLASLKSKNRSFLSEMFRHCCFLKEGKKPRGTCERCLASRKQVYHLNPELLCFQKETGGENSPVNSPRPGNSTWQLWKLKEVFKHNESVRAAMLALTNGSCKTHVVTTWLRVSK